MATKIVKCNLTDSGGVLVPTPADGREPPTPIIIAPDQAGVLWYWDADPNPAPVDVE